MNLRSLFRTAAIFLILSGPAAAQGASVAFGAADYDPDAPVEVTSDTLSVDQSDGSAVFTGNVVVAQTNLRMSAGEIRVEYTEGPNREIARLIATGGVTLVSGEEAAEAQEAVYSPIDREVVMTGDVLLTQELTAISGDRLVIDLDSGTGVMEGRVRTILQSADR